MLESVIHIMMNDEITKLTTLHSFDQTEGMTSDEAIMDDG